MTNKNILEKLKEIKVDKRKLKNFLKTHFIKIYESILKNTNFLNENSTFSERLYCVKNNLKQIPFCKNCEKNKVKFNSDIGQYRQYCCAQCSKKSNLTKEKRQETCLKKYKTKNFNNIEKSKQTRFLKNNGNYHSKDFSKKVKKTKLERYGDENFNNKEKISFLKNNLSEKQKIEISEKVKKTKLERYGDENFNNKEKAKITCLKKYKTEFPMQNEKIKEKSLNSTLKKYKVKNNFLIPQNLIKKLKPKKLILWKELTNELKYSTPLFSKEDFINCLPKDILKFKCETCGNIFESIYKNGLNNKCEKCFKIDDKRSLGQSEIINFLKTIFKGEILKNVRNIISPQELDIYIPDKKLAIEFDGLYWHCDERKDKNYHLKKTEACEKLGIQLIHIFEDEWKFKKQIIKNKLKYLISGVKRKIFARNCTIKEINCNLKNKFLNKYHIQGEDKAKINIGLFFKNRLVAIATFGKSRFNKKYEFELYRYATIFNFSILGGFGKLLKYFERNFKPNCMITYADRRWSQGKLYNALDFTLINKSSPNYFYIKGFLRESRLKYQKHKLKNILEKYDEKLTEYENMKLNGFHKIYDCGNLVFVKNFK